MPLLFVSPMSTRSSSVQKTARLKFSPVRSLLSFIHAYFLAVLLACINYPEASGPAERLLSCGCIAIPFFLDPGLQHSVKVRRTSQSGVTQQDRRKVKREQLILIYFCSVIIPSFRGAHFFIILFFSSREPFDLLLRPSLPSSTLFSVRVKFVNL